METPSFSASDAEVQCGFEYTKLMVRDPFTRPMSDFTRPAPPSTAWEGLNRDPAAEMAHVQNFRGVRREVTEKDFYFNPTIGFPCFRNGVGSRPHCLGKSKNETHPEINPHMLHIFHLLYAPHNRMLYKMSGHDFGWDSPMKGKQTNEREVENILFSCDPASA